VRILAIKFKQIGDVLLWEPALRRIKEVFPEAELHVATHECSAPVIKNAPYIDKLILYARLPDGSSTLKKFLHEFSFYRGLRKVSYDLVLCFSEGDRTLLTSLLTGGKYRAGLVFGKKEKWQKKVYHRAILPPPTHTVLRDFFIVCKALDLDFISPQVRLYVDEESINKADRILKEAGIGENEPFVCIHPVAKWFLKCWPAEYYPSIIEWFLKKGLKVVITAGREKREIEFVEKIFTLMKKRRGVINFAGKLELEELIGIISKSNLFFGIDTAPMHIAAALDKPVIVIFGPTGKREWGPWDNEVKISGFESPYTLRGTQRHGKHLVIQKDWSCIPCGGKNPSCKDAPSCLKKLTPQEILPLLEKFFIKN